MKQDRLTGYYAIQTESLAPMRVNPDQPGLALRKATSPSIIPSYGKKYGPGDRFLPHSAVTSDPKLLRMRLTSESQHFVEACRLPSRMSAVAAIHKATLALHWSVACDEELRLSAIYNLATKHHNWAAAALNRLRPICSEAAYADVVQLVEDARLQCERTRVEMQLHRDEHGCNGR